MALKNVIMETRRAPDLSGAFVILRERPCASKISDSNKRGAKMRVIVVDNQLLRLYGLMRKIKKLLPRSVDVKGFRRLSEAQQYSQEHSVDIAFLDMEMQQSYGLFLAKKLQEINPRINIIFVSDSDAYALDGWKIPVSDYLIKPVKPEQLGRSLVNLRYEAVS